MPMFDDPSKELEKLQAQLLEDEDWFERELDSAKRMIDDMPARKAAPAKANPKTGNSARNSANGHGEGQAQPQIRELKLTEDAPQPKAKSKKKKTKEKSNRGLIILALLEALGILGLAGYWVLVLL